MKSFKAPYIPKEKVWSKVEEFRRDHPRAQRTPVDVFDLVELDLGLEIFPLPGLRDFGDVEALLTGDLTGIRVDEKIFSDLRYEGRLRFSVAHEIGHYVLHRDIYENATYSSTKEWTDFFASIPQKEYFFIENQAYEFAGRLLVPKATLEEELDLQKKQLTADVQDREMAIEYIAEATAKRFGVSGQVILRRIQKEEISLKL